MLWNCKTKRTRSIFRFVFLLRLSFPGLLGRRGPGNEVVSQSCIIVGPRHAKSPGRHDTWFRVICIWNHLRRVAAVIGFSFKERFLRFQLLFPDFYHFHHVIWGMKWAKKLKTKNGQNMSSGPFSHDATQIGCFTGKSRIASNEIFLTFVLIRNIVLPFVSKTISWMT